MDLRPYLFKPHHQEPDGDIWLPHHFWIGLIVMLAGWLWWGSDPAGSHVTVIGLYIVADDVLEHYFGWPMPLDRAFKWAMKNDRFRSAYLAVLRRIY